MAKDDLPHISIPLLPYSDGSGAQYVVSASYTTDGTPRVSIRWLSDHEVDFQPENWDTIKAAVEKAIAFLRETPSP